MSGAGEKGPAPGNKESAMRKKVTTILFILIFLIGLSLLLYPTVSDHWNSFHQSKMIISHAENVDRLGKDECEKLIAGAQEYNKALRKFPDRWNMTGAEKKQYEEQLISDETKIISYVEIPKIKISLPVYHGTGAAVLQEAIGHMEGTSLPVGGEGTHCVLSGHRGLPSAKLFTDLDKLVLGDQFLLYTLNEVLTYEVDQIRVVLPTDLSTLAFEEGKDYCTLFTCTPYGVNTHRLMVRAHRVETVETKHILVTAEALQIDEITVALIIGVPILALVFIIVLVRPRRKKISEMRFGL